MKLIYSILCCITLVVCSCGNNEKNAANNTDSLGNTVAPGNSLVTPNSNSAVMPTDQQTNSGSLDTGKIDSIVRKDSLNN
jgi:hypothetical protein